METEWMKYRNKRVDGSETLRKTDGPSCVRYWKAWISEGSGDFKRNYCNYKMIVKSVASSAMRYVISFAMRDFNAQPKL
ncbi:MAG: hypothetical protein DI535_12530 [Citrobacter freundii]|nr:MAG: hypothetical protein DI535_12530 [Citrobacter freundii]